MQAHNRNLSEWLNRVSTGQLKLPRFQRFEAWNHERVRNLLQTVLQGLPAGAALILEIGENEPFISRPVVGAPMPTERVTEHLLDGQQRITALWRSLNDNYDERTYFVYFDEQAGPKKPLVFGQPRWDRGGKRYPVWADDIGEIYRKGYIPLRLLRPMEIGKELADWCKNAVGNNFDDLAALSFRITELREKCATFNLPYLSLSAGTPKDTAIDVFIQMNTSAAPLSAFDIVVAQVEGVAGKSLHELVESIKTSAPAVESYAEPSDLVLGVAALREDHPPTTASYLSLDLQKLVSEWDQVVSGIAFATEFLEQERVFDGERLPTSAILPLLAALKSTMPKALDSLGQARTLLRQYVWRSFVTDRYENAAATRALQDFRGLRSVILESKLHSVVPIFSEQEYPLPTIEELKRSGWPKKRDILGRGILAVSLRGGAWDIADGTPVTRTNLNDREYHHLFPDALISSLAEGQCDSFLALNCALVTWNTNRNIAAKEPLKYLKERVERAPLGEQEIRSRLATHAVPFDELRVGGYAAIADKAVRDERIAADYARFLNRRSEIILSGMKELCAGHNWTGMQVTTATSTSTTPHLPAAL